VVSLDNSPSDFKEIQLREGKRIPSPKQYWRSEQREEVNIAMVVLRNSKISIGEAADVAKVFQDLLSLEDRIDQDKEHFYVMHLDSHRRINLVELVAIGTLTDANIHPRETFRRAVIEGSYSIIVAHNHPSGDLTPSENDIKVTHMLYKAGEVLRIPLLDHIIFTGNKYYSFQKHNLQSTGQRETASEAVKDPLCQYQIAKRINAP
jgi:DNA repair protein RadC